MERHGQGARTDDQLAFWHAPPLPLDDPGPRAQYIPTMTPHDHYASLIRSADSLAADLEREPGNASVAARLEELQREIETARCRMKAYDTLEPLRERAIAEPGHNGGALDLYAKALQDAGLFGLACRVLSAEIDRIQVLPTKTERDSWRPRQHDLASWYNQLIHRIKR